MALCFSIFERGFAIASTQLQRESGAQWKRVLQESLFAGSWMSWKPTTKSPVTISNATSMSAYRNSKRWGLFNATASFMGLGSPARGVDMFRTTWCASVKTELSNALGARTYDSTQ